jgi:hypothetical protein
MPLIEHKAEQKVFMNKNDKFDVEKHKEELADRLTKMSDEILSHDPLLIHPDRMDLMYMEDDFYLWRTNMVKQMSEYDMLAVLTIIKKRHESKQYKPGFGGLSESFT